MEVFVMLMKVLFSHFYTQFVSKNLGVLCKIKIGMYVYVFKILTFNYKHGAHLLITNIKFTLPLWKQHVPN